MKNPILQSAFIFISLVIATTKVVGQTSIEMSKLSTSVCPCMEEKLSTIRSPSKDFVQSSLSVCLIEAIEETGLKLDLENDELISSLAERLGLRMMLLCPQIVSLFGDNRPISTPKVDETVILTVRCQVYVYNKKRERFEEQKDQRKYESYTFSFAHNSIKQNGISIYEIINMKNDKNDNPQFDIKSADFAGKLVLNKETKSLQFFLMPLNSDDLYMIEYFTTH